MKIGAVIVSAGKGRRMQKDIPKQYLPLAGKPVLQYTLETFNDCPLIKDIILVVAKDDVQEIEKTYKDMFAKLIKVVPGGQERTESVTSGVQALPDDIDYVAVHDGVRPLLSSHKLLELIKGIEEGYGIIPGVPVKDTIKRIDEKGYVQETLPREELIAAQTPQFFPRKKLLELLGKDEGKKQIFTDEAGLWEQYGLPVKVLAGEYTNIKLTTPEDFLLAEAFLKGNEKK